MNKKNKLMKALVGLELSNKAKQEFCDIVLDKSDNESSGGGAGTAEPEFLYTNANMLQGGLGALMQQYAVWVKLTDGNNIVICSALLMTTSYSSYTPIAFALALNTRAINKNNDEDVTLNSLINSGSIDLSSYEITEEQFYSLEA